MGKGKTASSQKIKIRCSQCGTQVRASTAEMLATGAFCRDCVGVARLSQPELLVPIARLIEVPKDSPSGLSPRRRRDYDARQRGRW